MHWLRLGVLLVGAAILEVGGDALVRMGLQRRPLPMVAGALALIAYGLLVNLSSLDFGRLMGVYIVTFFLVSQLIAIAFFGQLPALRTLLGGALMVAGAVAIMA